MSSYINSPVHYKAIQQSLLEWLKNNRHYIDAVKHELDNAGLIHLDAIESLKEITFIIIMHMIRLQVTCVSLQYRACDREDSAGVRKFVSEQTETLFVSAKLQSRVPTYTYPALHKIMRGYLYQVEMHQLEGLPDDMDDEVTYLTKVKEFIDWIVNVMLNKYVTSQYEYEQAPWGLDDGHKKQ